jgi:hypothetical protein
MANEKEKDFNAMLQNSKDMPKIKEITDEGSIKRYGGTRMLLAPPLDYDREMRKVPFGKLVTTEQIRKDLSNQYNADFTCPLTAGIFISIAAWASEQRAEDKTPYWRTLKANGELNPKYPGGVEAQKEKLEAEGHEIVSKDTKNPKFFVSHFEDSLVEL